MKLSKKLTLCLLAVSLLSGLWPSVSSASSKTAKPGPNAALKMLQDGNARFVAGESNHPNTGAARLAQAGTENQGDHAFATVIACSDSRVPVERLFDAGIMDIFVVRVAGNVCDTDEVGSIEYGLSHVNTPVLVVLGHTQCGAVTAVTHTINGSGHALELNIPPLVDNIGPAVFRAQHKHSDIHGDAIIPYAIEENVWQSIEDLFIRSPSTRNLVNSGQVKVVGAIYDVATGTIKWLPQSHTTNILAQVESNPGREMNAMAGGGHNDSHGETPSATRHDSGHAEPAAASHGGGHAEPAAASHGGGHAEPAAASYGNGHSEPAAASHGEPAAASHGGGHGAPATASHGGGHASGSAADQAAVASLIRKITSHSKETPTHSKKVSSAGLGKNAMGYGLLGLTTLLALVLVYYFARTKDSNGDTKLSWTLGSKIVGGFSIIVIGLAGLSVYALTSMNSIGAQIETIAEELIPITNAVATIETHQLEQAITLERAFRYGEEEGAHAAEMFEHEIELFEEFAQEVDTEIAEAIALIEEIPAHNQAQADEMTEVMNHLEVIGQEHQDFDHLAEKVFEILHAKNFAQARLLEEHVEKAEDELNHELEALLISMEERCATASNKAESDEHHAAFVLIISSIISVLIGFGVAVQLTRSIINPVNRIISGLSEGALQVASASGQVSTASQSLAQGATEQAAALEETSASMEEMASMNRQSTENANQANILAQEAREMADNGSQSMEQMNTAINEIQKSSSETAKIIKVIDEIAFQTNLLALNAAVEAARAGEAGKGFAVVAEEVRNLAMRSAEAAKNTSALIEESVKNAQNGVEITNEVGKSLTEIVTGISKTSELVNEISVASEEQTKGIGQISTAITQMETVTQSNSASAEESASASEELNAQAQQMQEMVSQLISLVEGTKLQSVSGASLSTSDQAFHQISTAPVRKAPKSVAPAPSKVSAEQTIPMGDESFKEF